MSIRTHDVGEITAVSIAECGLPTRKLVELARENLQTPVNERDERTISADEAANAMLDALKRVGLGEWQILVTEKMNARMAVRSVEKQVKIRQGEIFSEQEVRRLLVHEIGTHVFRYTNGNSQPLRLLRTGLVGYIMTEEGMATYNENKFGVRDSATTRIYALRVIAAHLSLTHSYFDVFSHLTQFTDREEAFNITTRAKRGFRDTSEYGSHIKDKVYFEGFHTVSNHINACPEDYSLLMSGKVSLNMIPAIKELQVAGLLLPPAHLPDMMV